jgi:hypothetical protein
MTMANRDHETLAASLRRHGTPVDDPKADNLREELQATLDRMRAGETLAELSRRDPEALCALAMERPLTAHEARMLLAAVRYRDGLLAAAERSLAAERDWGRYQRENADLWARDCAALGKAVGQIAGVVGLGEDAKLEAIVEAVGQNVGGWTSAVRRGRVGELLELANAFSVPPDWSDLAGDDLEEARRSLVEEIRAAVTVEAEDAIITAPRPVVLSQDPTTSVLVRASNELAELRELARGVAELLGEPGLEQEPERLRALLVERMAVDDIDPATPACPGAGCCPWSPYQERPA